MKKFLAVMFLAVALMATSCGTRGSKAASDTSVAPCDTTCVCDSVCVCDSCACKAAVDTVVAE